MTHGRRIAAITGAVAAMVPGWLLLGHRAGVSDLLLGVPVGAGLGLLIVLIIWSRRSPTCS